MSAADVILLYTDDEVREWNAKRPSRVPVTATNNALDQRPVETAIAAWPRAALEKFRDDHALTGASLVLFCGRLREKPSTELEVAICALAILAKENPRVRLAVIGTGAAESSLRAFATQEGVNDRILWLGEIYSEIDLAPWFLSAKCFVYPGAVGLSLLHAFGYALPVVTHSSRKLHNPEISALRDGVNGLLFEQGNAEQLAKQIGVICEDSQLRSRMSEAAKRTVATEFSMDGMVERFAESIRMASKAALAR